MRPQMYSNHKIFESISIVLARQGYEALTLNNIAEQAKLSPSILSKRFGSKKEMLLAYYEFLVELTQKGFSDLSKSSLQLVEALTEIFTQWHNFIKTPQEYANFMTLYLKLDLDPEFGKLSQKRRHIINVEVQAILEKSIQRGEIKCLDIVEMSQVLQAAATGASILWCGDHKNINPRKLIATSIKMIVENNRGEKI